MGSVERINVKREIPGARGLPKLPVSAAEVRVTGLVGDFNRYRHEELNDDPDSAVLLLSTRILGELQAEGWPVRPGDLGENFTVAGVPDTDLQPGVVLRVGSATVQVARRCDPCRNLFLLPYVGPQRGPEFLRVTLGRRGWYARVLAPGTVRTGDPVERVPPPAGPAASPANL